MATITPDNYNDSHTCAFIEVDVSSHSSSSSSLSSDNSKYQFSDFEAESESVTESHPILGNPISDHNPVLNDSPSQNPDTLHSDSSSSLADSKYQLSDKNLLSKPLLEDELFDSNNSDSKNASGGRHEYILSKNFKYSSPLGNPTF